MKISTIFILEIITLSAALIAIPAVASDIPLRIFGNANMDDSINEDDVEYLKGIIDGTYELTELADANYDGEIDEDDITQINSIIGGEEKTLTIIDSSERIVTINKPVERLVVGFRFILETLRPLKVPTEMIVGVPSGVGESDERTKYFSEYQDLPLIGNLWGPNIEAILSLNPDLVFMYYRTSNPETTIDVLNMDGIPVACFASGVASSYSVFGYNYYPIETKMLGYVLDKEDEAEEFINWYEGVVYPIIERAKDIPEEDRPKVYVESYSNPYSISTDSHIESAGGKNIFADSSGTINPESVIEQNPDIIVKIVSTYTFDDDVTGYLVTDTSKIAEVREEIMNRPELANVTAVKNGEVYVISAYLTGGGPDSGARNFLELAYFAKLFHPEIFADLDPQAIHQEYLTRFQGLDIDLNERGVFVYPPLEA